jgi:hypothetical protein
MSRAGAWRIILLGVVLELALIALGIYTSFTWG